MDKLDGETELIKFGQSESKDMIFYIGYVFLALILINVVCIVVHCYKKATLANKKKYKVVSMKSSDTEMDA